MPRYAQLVIGPAGSGKSTYCSTMVKHGAALHRTMHVVNLDPAAEHFDYNVLADIRDLIQLDDAMEDDTLRYGPNGGLVFCMEYFAQNFDWLHEELDDVEDDYILFDCPGQIELYTHLPVMQQLVEKLQSWGFYVCAVFVVDAQFMLDTAKFVSGLMSALSAMVMLELPHINVMSKLDLVNKSARKQLDKYLEPDMKLLLAEEFEHSRFSKKFARLNHALASVIDDYSLVRFFPLDITDEESINSVLLNIDLSIQYGEDQEPKEIKDPEDDEGGENLTMFNND